MRAPPSFLCPISQEIMRDPVNCAAGQSYERANIERWLASHDTAPQTGAQLPNKTLTPNHALRNSIEEWLTAYDLGRLAARRPRAVPQRAEQPAASRERPAVARERDAVQLAGSDGRRRARAWDRYIRRVAVAERAVAAAAPGEQHGQRKVCC